MPTISSITPDKFDTGKSVTLAGSGFGTSEGSVLIAGQSQTITSWSDTSITFTTVRGSQSLGACRVDVVGGSGGVTPLLFDGFESGNFSTTNAAGFAWTGTTRTSIVTMDGSANVVIHPTYNYVNDGRNWAAKTGSNSMRFRYPAGDNEAEQRFNLGANYTELWLRYWIRVPTNFYHGTLNNKFLSMWPTNYDTFGTVTWQTRPGSSGNANIVYQDGGVASGEVGSTAFINRGTDLGRWMQVCFYVKSATSSTANDGVIRFYRKWDGDSSWTLIHEKTNAKTWDAAATTQGIKLGYLMGWANDPYTSDTEWLVDDVTFATESLL